LEEIETIDGKMDKKTKEQVISFYENIRQENSNLYEF